MHGGTGAKPLGWRGVGRVEQQLVLQVNVDVVFAVNFLADVAWLLIAALLAGVRPRLWRVVLGAATGAAAAVWVWFPTGRWLASVPGLVLGTAAMLGVTFWPCRVRQALRVVGAALVGGTVLAGSNLLLGTDHRPGPGVSLSSALGGIGMLLCLGGGRYIWDALTTRARLARGAYALRIRLGERSIETTALLDTGNSLRDPLSRLPVVVAEAAVLADLLPEGVLAAVQAGWDGLDRLPPGWLSRCRLIPFRSVGQPGGMLLAFTPDEIWVRAPAAARWVQVRAMVGIAVEPLHPGGAYRALLSAEVYQAGEGEPGITWKGETGC